MWNLCWDFKSCKGFHWWYFLFQELDEQWTLLAFVHKVLLFEWQEHFTNGRWQEKGKQKKESITANCGDRSSQRSPQARQNSFTKKDTECMKQRSKAHIQDKEGKGNRQLFFTLLFCLFYTWSFFFFFI